MARVWVGVYFEESDWERVREELEHLGLDFDSTYEVCEDEEGEGEIEES